jgi:tetratricopeptide (TPR) repeat protein
MRSTVGWPLVGLGLVGLGMFAAGCDYSSPVSRDLTSGSYRPGSIRLPITAGSTKQATAARDSVERTAILESSIKLIQGAALQPGGDNFRLATQKLNQFFEGTSATEYQLDPACLEFLSPQLPPQLLQELQSAEWTLRDARHLEDCMLYYGIANRVGGTGDDLSRTLRVFDWVTRHVQLVPRGSLGGRQLPQVIARPYDVLLRGMATESEGLWAERSWVFMVLCRQLGVDVGLLTYTKGNVVEPPTPSSALGALSGSSLLSSNPASGRVIPWICVALIDDQAYLFDARVGLPVPGPDGREVATLEEVMSDGSLLEALDLPGQSPYETSRASLLASPSKLGVLIDSSLGYSSRKMLLLQNELAGKNRTILYRDPADQRDHFARVLGQWFGRVSLWSIPLEVETRLFTDPQFVASIQQSLTLFRPEFPLIFARIKHLRGDLSEAVQDYISFRFTENAPLLSDKRKVIPREIQEGLDVYATYYLALAHLERDNLDQAELMFRKILEILPEPGGNQPYYYMFRWGAHANLGRIYESQGDFRRAIAHYSQSNPTTQKHGNLLRARALVWDNPMAAVPDPLPPAPESFTTVRGTLSRVGGDAR